MEAVRRKNNIAAAAAKADDMAAGDGMMAMCSDHPYRSNLGGICAFCLQEKLGKLVSSSSSFPAFPFLHNSPRRIPSSTSSPSPVSDVGPSPAPPPHSIINLAVNKTTPYDAAADGEAASRRAPRIPFLLASRRTKKKKKQQLPPGPPGRGGPAEAVLKRSKSSSGTRRHFMDDYEDGYSPRTRRGSGGGFWSFLHLSASSSSSSKSAASRKGDKPSNSSLGGAADSKVDGLTAFGEESPGVNSNHQFPAFERKVSRSRSVGCGSRSFSGDFFERISTGFGDCTLRRVESHREGHSSRTPKQAQCQQQAQKMYKCGGIFGGFMMIATPSSASSAASSTYWLDDHHHHQTPGKATSALNNGGNSRGRSWNWAFPSPMRAFAKPSKDGKREINIIRDGSSGKNSGCPNLSAIPSLLTVGG